MATAMGQVVNSFMLTAVHLKAHTLTGILQTENDDWIEFKVRQVKR